MGLDFTCNDDYDDKCNNERQRNKGKIREGKKEMWERTKKVTQKIREGFIAPSEWEKISLGWHNKCCI